MRSAILAGAPDHRFLVQAPGNKDLSARTGYSHSAGENGKVAMNVVTESSHEFGEFVRDYREALLKLAFWMCGDWHASEDIVQDALMAIYRRWPGLYDAGPTCSISATCSTVYACTSPDLSFCRR
jgi:hypothetical protein